MAATLHRYRAQYYHLKREMYFTFSHLVDVFFLQQQQQQHCLLLFVVTGAPTSVPFFFAGGCERHKLYNISQYMEMSIRPTDPSGLRTPRATASRACAKVYVSKIRTLSLAMIKIMAACAQENPLNPQPPPPPRQFSKCIKN